MVRIIVVALVLWPNISWGCPGDFDGNGQIDFDDFIGLAGAFLKTPEDPEYSAIMDFDNNGIINFNDFVSFARVFGNSCTIDTGFIAGKVQLTHNDAIELFPVWSPAGDQIAYLSFDFENTELWIAGVGGSGATRLVEEVVSPEDTSIPPAWSPDGGKIAFSSNRDGNAELYTIDMDGTNLTRLTNNDRDDWGPVWSPDGTGIVHVSGDSEADLDLYKMNADGTNIIRLTNNEVPDIFPVWSPDGEKIAYSSRTNTWNETPLYQVWAMNADGSDITRLSEDAHTSVFPSWSPDGTKIAFWSDRAFREGQAPGQSGGDLFIMNSDGTNVEQLTEINLWDDLWSIPQWSPNGTKIAFVSNHGADGFSQIYIIDVESKVLKRLTTWVYEEGMPAWSPDGTKIVLGAQFGSWDLFITAFTE